MKAILPRTGSLPGLASPFGSSSPRVSFSSHDPTGRMSSCEKIQMFSRRISLQSGINCGNICRAWSESDMILSEIDASRGSRKLTDTGSRSFSPRIAEDDELRSGAVRSLTFDASKVDQMNNVGEWTGRGFLGEQCGIAGDGAGKYRKPGNGGGSGGDDSFGTTGGADRIEIGAYYQEILKSNPSDPLVLRNYGKYLHEVAKDMVKAEEYYARAILESPGDGEVLSLYGTLIWETQRDEDRAKSYFDQAINVSPDDCMVLGSYAHFMWEAEEEEEVREEIKGGKEAITAAVEAF